MDRLTPAEVAAINASNAQLRAARAQEKAAREQAKTLTTIKGDKGEPGSRGEVGPAGASIVGPPGLRGRDGADGQPGTSGRDGLDGAPGTPGRDGVGPDEKVKLDAADPEAGFLEDKLQPGLNVSFRRSKDGKALVIDSKGGGRSVSVQAPGGGGGAGPAGPPGDAGPGVPTGGTTDQVLTKASNADLDTEWRDPTGGPDTDDQTAAEVPFTPAGTIAATNVQAAIEEVAAEAGSGSQDIEAVLTEGNDAGGKEVTNLGQVTVNPGAINLYGLLIQALAGFDDNYNAFIRVYDEFGSRIFNIDTGGMDFVAKPGDDDIHLQMRTDLGNLVAELSTDIGLTVSDSDLGAYINISRNTGFQISAFVPSATPNAGVAQIYYDATDGAATLRWKGKSADGTVVSGSLGGGSVTPATDPGDIADPTLATPESNALAYNALLDNMRAVGLVA